MTVQPVLGSQHLKIISKVLLRIIRSLTPKRLDKLHKVKLSSQIKKIMPLVPNNNQLIRR